MGRSLADSKESVPHHSLDVSPLLSHLLPQTVRHGFPHQPSSMAFDPVQKILAVGTQGGALRLYPFAASTSRRPCSPAKASGKTATAGMLLACACQNRLAFAWFFRPGKST